VRLALTATATKRVAQDIMERLDIKARNTVRLPSSRKNLVLSVAYFPYPDDGYSEKLKTLLESLPLLAKGGSVIIYVSKRQLAVTLANDLLLSGYNAKAYHSAIANREEVENWFLRAEDNPDKEMSPIVVGTTAFGMGIDKSDVRSVVHFDLSRSVEDYVQGKYCCHRPHFMSITALDHLLYCPFLPRNYAPTFRLNVIISYRRDR
jgi:ATP-dependent DNA helicase RecQ